MTMDSLGITLDTKDSISFWPRRADESSLLVIETSGAYCEIGLARVHVETLRSQLPNALAGMDRWAAEDDACTKAGATEKRAVDTAARALDLATITEAAGAHDLATSLRTAAAEASARAAAVDAAVRAFEEATREADFATEKLIFAMCKATSSA